MTNLKMILCALAGAAVGASAADVEPRTVTVGEKTGAAIQRAINEVAWVGRGKVVVPCGVYPTTSLRLRSGVELHLEKNAVIRGSDRPFDYAYSDDELARPGLLQAFGEKDVAITGEGTVEIDGKLFFDCSAADLWGQFFHPYEGPRPEMLQMVRCRNVRLQGVTFRNSPLWTMRLRLCEKLRIEGVRIEGDLRFINADGIDVDGCRDVAIRGCRISSGDDAIILRAIPERGSAERIVTENVLVEDCELESACQAIRIGCPSDETIRHAVFRNIRAKGRNGIFFDNPLHYLSEGDEGRLEVDDILFENVKGEFHSQALKISVAPGIALRGIRNVTFKNVDLKSPEPPSFVGNIRSRIEGLRREGFVFNGRRLEDGPIAADCTNAEPFGNEKRPRSSITRRRPGWRPLPEQRRSY